jgi:hypothetical protein
MPQNQGITFNMGLGHSPSIVVDGLVFMIDPNNTNSYSGYGNTVYNLVNPSIGGTFVGYTSNPIDNTENRSIFFDGIDDYILCNAISQNNNASALTWIIWAKRSASNSLMTLLQYSSLTSDISLELWSNGVIYFEIGNGGNTYGELSNNSSSWQNIAMVFDGSGVDNSARLKAYINGVQQNLTYGGTTIPSTAGSGNTLYIGNTGPFSSSNSNLFSSGNLGSFQSYNRALSAQEILQNYNATKKKYNPDENIVTNGLVLNIDSSKNASYPGSGNLIYDLSGFGNTGTLTNGPTFSALNNGSIVLDGTNDYITFNNAYASSFGITSNATLSIWAKITRKNQYTSFVGFYNPAAGNRSDFGIDITSSNTIRLWKNDSQADTGVSFINNKWTNFVITSDSSTVKLYRDTVLLYTGNVSGAINNNRMLAIGYNWDVMINASVSQTLLYNKTLSQQEVSQNYNATKNRFINALPPVRNGLVLELDAGQRASYPGTGNTWYDLSGNNLNGALTNGPTFSGIGATSSIVFDRSNDYINVGDSTSLNTFTGMTLEVIVKYNSTNDQIFVQKWNYTLGNDGYTLEILNSAIVGACYSAGNSYLSVSISGYPINNIYHIVFTLNGSTQTMYINGVSVATNSGGSVPNTAGKNLMIGQRSTAGTYFGGNNYLTKFYNRGLSAYEVKQNFDYYRTRYNI